MADKAKTLLVLENGTLLSMALNAKTLAAFPFLGLIVPAPGTASCGSCRNAENKLRLAQYEVVKQRIAALSGEMKRKLKDLLKTDQARVYYKSTGGRAMSLTF